MKGLFGRPNALTGMARGYPPTQRNALTFSLGEGRQEPDYGQRVDGTKKGRGFLGELKTRDGRVMTEYSIGVDWGEGEIEIPSVVPTLTQGEIQHLTNGGEPTRAMIDKAIAHAKARRAKGLSPFAMRGLDY